MAKSLKRVNGSRKSLRKGRKSLRRGKGFRKMYGGDSTTELRELVTSITGGHDGKAIINITIEDLNKVKTLIENGADINALNKNKKTVLDIVLDNEDEQIQKSSALIVLLLKKQAEGSSMLTHVQDFVDRLKLYLPELNENTIISNGNIATYKRGSETNEIKLIRKRL
jgi:hypothetical protein